MNSLLNLLLLIINFYGYAVLIYVLMSWLPDLRNSSFGRLIGSICEPYLAPFRKIIPTIGGLDISPIVAILVLRLASQGLKQVFTFFF